jgi:two-component system osmolarity sensor histidine kinase EnvZ
MNFDWLKRLLPRGLYGRAALILILPIVTIQLVVSTAFIQDHFADVTRQMSRNIALEVDYLVERVNEAPDLASALDAAHELGRPLALDIHLPVAEAGPQDRVFYDLSGRVVIETLRVGLKDVAAVDLGDLRRVRLVLGTRHGLMEVDFNRRRVSASNPHQLLVLMVATGALMTLIAVLFLRNQLRPIRRLARAAEAFGKGRIVPYKPGGAVEVRSAGNAFVDMRNRIERQIEQRTLMLSGVSHDLRTPLTRLKLGLSMLEDGEDVQGMRRDIDDMQRLLDAFLDFARDEAQEGPAETVDPAVFVGSVVDDCIRAGQAVKLASVSGIGVVALRPDAVRRALENLIGNAVRYGTHAEVSVAILERAVRITIEDDGPGIPKARREEAMRPFTRLDHARNQNRGSGVGLGLSIAADIARSHGGALRLGDSERLGGLKAELVLAR